MKICFLGFGRRGKTLYGHLASIKGISVAGIFDPVCEVSYPVKYYADSRTMLSECMPDLVVDAAPPKYRFNNIMLCDEFKVPLICEKPLLFSKKQLGKLKKVKINIYPAYQLNYDGLIQKTFSVANIKDIQSIALAQKVNLKLKGWRSDKRIAGGGALSDNGAHLINLVVKKFGLPRKVFANSVSIKSGVESAIDGLLWYSNFTVKFSANWNSPVGKETRIDITTNIKDVHFIETNQGKSLRTNFSVSNGEWTQQTEESFYESRGLDRDLSKNPFNQSSGDATARMLSIFVDDVISCHGRRSVLARVGFQAAIETARVIDALYESVSKGRIIEL